MKIGYACLAIAVPGSEMKSCILKNAGEERLIGLIGHNLNALETLIDYNVRNGIRLFRISSDLIPFGSSEAMTIPWSELFSEKLAAVGKKIRDSGMRVSMHPGQYTVLNSPDSAVVKRAVTDLEYHAKVLDSLGLGPENKLVLHTGGVYGDKKQAARRFLSAYGGLSAAVKRRLALENDDKLFHIGDVMESSAAAGIPAVYDNLHNAVNPADRARSDSDWIGISRETWKEADGPQKIHYSQQHPCKKPGAHSDSVGIGEFSEFIRNLSGTPPDVMLEVKDKNLSALKCLNCASNRGINALEAEWARYKYLVLERSAQKYLAVRQLLRDKTAYPAHEMYRMIEASLKAPAAPEAAVNAAQHVWGYFKDKAGPSEKKRFENALGDFVAQKTGIFPVKNLLLALARKYREDYLLNGYYFYF
ncbi:MAG TPA: UV DNA damage repair endonuclease UvsE [Oscillospiraceae bacterium]|nr:UV DNA damage repair endonuclease UvsE [Oscillospiraceae bacterium]HPS34832.1 UV DNA damage repair endonuclease UvsE [Oscillospiraceae bacterium]